MKTLLEHLSQYAHYHRDVRNIATHFVGVPLIVLAVIWLLYVPILSLQSIVLTPALCISIIVSLFYLKLNIVLGILMSALLSCGYIVAEYYFYLLSDGLFLFYTLGFLFFIVGWGIQFVGHYFEGKKPAFVDDLMGLVIGPLFVVVEMLFKLGLFKELEKEIISISGPYRGGS
ncbi:Mpo1 family 2-hydroxy fatty acid dioxygenase [Pseudoalteromonas aurantia]|uniref:DUF962 domain-containing protein n=1 Tax=Pseudoalteromonas aurantia 208 TaxID=1314867 RepID=A0ABR9EBH2_9GAMM|nr:Mpo1-like protein [Pseudoalteromonas aurantia]MBE0367595.1 hypothetical protein [Pseudoalteromonas aurantia 208]